MPAWLRERVIRAQGTVRLELPSQGVRTALVLKVVRAMTAVGPTAAGPLLRSLRSGRHPATLPELERLARALRAAGVEARTVRG
ncbi:hypothetical protein ACFW1A_24525 [Kitasatospora sp. NPDC058965]|uniref:hypothetical protein n=1 Tax=Kitasatospora sp. NPDC058965 TaxID=3346682 RepID=UPI0036876DF7